MQSWLKESLLKEFMNSSKIFRKCSEEFKRDVSAAMEQLLLQADDNVAQRNPCHGLYFVKSGILRVGRLGASFVRKFAGDVVGDEELYDEASDLQVR